MSDEKHDINDKIQELLEFDHYKKDEPNTEHHENENDNETRDDFRAENFLRDDEPPVFRKSESDHDFYYKNNDQVTEREENDQHNFYGLRRDKNTDFAEDMPDISKYSYDHSNGRKNDRYKKSDHFDYYSRNKPISRADPEKLIRLLQSTETLYKNIQARLSEIKKEPHVAKRAIDDLVDTVRALPLSDTLMAVLRETVTEKNESQKNVRYLKEGLSLKEKAIQGQAITLSHLKNDLMISQNKLNESKRIIQDQSNELSKKITNVNQLKSKIDTFRKRDSITVKDLKRRILELEAINDRKTDRLSGITEEHSVLSNDLKETKEEKKRISDEFEFLKVKYEKKKMNCITYEQGLSDLYNQFINQDELQKDKPFADQLYALHSRKDLAHDGDSIESSFSFLKNSLSTKAEDLKEKATKLSILNDNHDNLLAQLKNLLKNDEKQKRIISTLREKLNGENVLKKENQWLISLINDKAAHLKNDKVQSGTGPLKNDEMSDDSFKDCNTTVFHLEQNMRDLKVSPVSSNLNENLIGKDQFDKNMSTIESVKTENKENVKNSDALPVYKKKVKKYKKVISALKQRVSALSSDLSVLLEGNQNVTQKQDNSTNEMFEKLLNELKESQNKLIDHQKKVAQLEREKREIVLNTKAFPESYNEHVHHENVHHENAYRDYAYHNRDYLSGNHENRRSVSHMPSYNNFANQQFVSQEQRPQSNFRQQTDTNTKQEQNEKKSIEQSQAAKKIAKEAEFFNNQQLDESFKDFNTEYLESPEENMPIDAKEWQKLFTAEKEEAKRLKSDGKAVKNELQDLKDESKLNLTSLDEQLKKIRFTKEEKEHKKQPETKSTLEGVWDKIFGNKEPKKTIEGQEQPKIEQKQQPKAKDVEPKPKDVEQQKRQVDQSTTDSTDLDYKIPQKPESVKKRSTVEKTAKPAARTVANKSSVRTTRVSKPKTTQSVNRTIREPASTLVDSSSSEFKQIRSRAAALSGRFNELEKKLDIIRSGKNQTEKDDRKQLKEQIDAYTEYYYTDFVDISGESEII